MQRMSAINFGKVYKLVSEMSCVHRLITHKQIDTQTDETKYTISRTTGG